MDALTTKHLSSGSSSSLRDTLRAGPVPIGEMIDKNLEFRKGHLE